MGFSTVKELREAYESDENDGFFKEIEDSGVTLGRSVYADHFFTASALVNPDLKASEREYFLFFVTDDLDVLQIGEDEYTSRYALDSARKNYVAEFERTGTISDLQIEYDEEDQDVISEVEADNAALDSENVASLSSPTMDPEFEYDESDINTSDEIQVDSSNDLEVEYDPDDVGDAQDVLLEE